jgi:hypothetical protein
MPAKAWCSGEDLDEEEYSGVVWWRFRGFPAFWLASIWPYSDDGEYRTTGRLYSGGQEYELEPCGYFWIGYENDLRRTRKHIESVAKALLEDPYCEALYRLIDEEWPLAAQSDLRVLLQATIRSQESRDGS